VIVISSINFSIRILVSFTLLWGVLRILGKKEMGKLTYYNMATAAALGTLSAGLITDTRTNPIYYLVPIIVFPILTYLMGYFSLKSISARKVFEGTPTMVISKGKIVEKNLKGMRLSTDNLLEKLREKKVFAVSDVEFAVMETDGKMSVLLKSENQPITPKDMNIYVKNKSMPINIIKDGAIIKENLSQVNMEEAWLKEQLKMKNIQSIEDVFLAQVDGNGDMYIDLK